MKYTIKHLSRVIFLVICLGLTGNSLAVSDPLIDGIELFSSGLYDDAYVKLLEAFEEHPENPELNFYLGRAAFETGQYEMAIMAFERVLIFSPQEHRVKLEMARAFHRLKANDLAREYCEQVLSSHPPESVRRNILQFIAMMERSEQLHFLSGFLSLGVDWTNNAWATPSSNIIRTIIGDVELSGDSSRKTQDWIYNKTIGLKHRYRFPDTKNTWQTQGTFHMSQYDTTKDLDLTLMAIKTGPEFIFGKNKLAVALFANEVHLGHNDYLDAEGINSTWAHAVTPGLITSTGIGIKKSNYAASTDKSAINKWGEAGIRINMLEAWFSVKGRAEKESARKKENTYERYSGTFSAHRPLFWGIQGALNYEYQYTHYHKPAALFTKKRTDEVHYAGCSLQKKIWQSKHYKTHYAHISLAYQRIWAYSNISLYEYTKDLVQLSLMYNF